MCRLLAYDVITHLTPRTIQTISIFYEGSDLDLYVSSSRAREVVMFLRTQNYEFFPGDRAGVSTNLESLLTDLETEGNKHFETDGLPMHYSGRGYHGTTIHGVLYFRHRENAALVVQIIAIYNYLPLICSLMWFHSSTCKSSTFVFQWRSPYAPS